jgi:hypothetical protein
MLVACRLAGLFALGACYAVVGARAVRADAAPQRSIPPRHAQNHALLADPTGRVSSNTPARPPAPAAPRIKRPDRELQRPSAATGVGRPMATTTPSLPQHPYRICLLSFDRGIFLTEGFQAKDRLAKGPPRPSKGASADRASPRAWVLQFGDQRARWARMAFSISRLRRSNTSTRSAWGVTLIGIACRRGHCSSRRCIR